MIPIAPPVIHAPEAAGVQPPSRPYINENVPNTTLEGVERETLTAELAALQIHFDGHLITPQDIENFLSVGTFNSCATEDTGATVRDTTAVCIPAGSDIVIRHTAPGRLIGNPADIEWVTFHWQADGKTHTFEIPTGSPNTFGLDEFYDVDGLMYESTYLSTAGLADLKEAAGTQAIAIYPGGMFDLGINAVDPDGQVGRLFEIPTQRQVVAELTTGGKVSLNQARGIYHTVRNHPFESNAFLMRAPEGAIRFLSNRGAMAAETGDIYIPMGAGSEVIIDREVQHRTPTPNDPTKLTLKFTKGEQQVGIHFNLEDYSIEELREATNGAVAVKVGPNGEITFISPVVINGRVVENQLQTVTTGGLHNLVVSDGGVSYVNEERSHDHRPLTEQIQHPRQPKGR